MRGKRIVWKLDEWNEPKYFPKTTMTVERIVFVGLNNNEGSGFRPPSLVLRSEQQNISFADMWDVRSLGNGFYFFSLNTMVDVSTSVSCETVGNDFEIISGAITLNDYANEN